jgi:large subunit ribosomal protein L28
MSRVCYFTGKKTRAGRSIARRGRAKYLGGVGRKTTGITKRKFKPNIQRVRALIDGRVCRLKVSAKAIRMGLVVKPPKRNWKKAAAPETHGPPTVEQAAAAPIEDLGPDSAKDAGTSNE